MASLLTSDSSYGTLMCCPYCTHPDSAKYLHLLDVEHLTSGYEGRFEGHLIFECEYGHAFVLTLRNHKGYTLVETVRTASIKR